MPSVPSSSVMQGSILSSLIFFPHPSALFVVAYGTFFGIATGMYYSNSHFVTLRLTNTTNRIYFSSLGQAFGTIVGLVIPPLAGFFITFGIAHALPSFLQNLQYDLACSSLYV